MLFSDSTQDATAAGRQLQVSGSSKANFHAMIAAHVFLNNKNPDYVMRYNACVAQGSSRFTTAVAEHLNKYV